MKILVTGAAGFAGSHLVSRLCAAGHQPVALVRAEDDRCRDLRERGIEVHVGSVTEPAVVRRAVAGCQRVFHLAAAFRRVNLSTAAYHAVNVDGTRNVLAAARDAGVERILHCSTCGVHGHVNGAPADEYSPIAPQDYYQASKWEAEEVIRHFLDEGLWITTVRPTAMYGPGDRGRFAMLFREVAKGRFFMIGPGTTLYHPVYITDLVKGMEQAIDADVACGQAYLVGGSSPISIHDLVSLIAEVLGVELRFIHVPYWAAWPMAIACEALYRPLPRDPPIFRRRLHWFRQNRSFDISKARRELGYAPSVELRAGLIRTAEWYRSNGVISSPRLARSPLAAPVLQRHNHSPHR